MPTIPGMIPNPGLFMQSDRMMNSPNMPLGMYNPSQYVDPMQAIAYQQMMAQQLFQMQNPRMTLPNNMGRALGTAIQGMMKPQDQSDTGANNTPQQQGQHDAYSAVKGAAHTLQQEHPGMTSGEALYKAADLMEGSGQFDNPRDSAILEQARQAAQHKYGYSPEAAARLQQERDLAGPVNLRLGDGTVQAFKKGTPEYNAALQNGATVAAETPQIPTGHTATFQDMNGVTHNGVWDGSKYVPASKFGGTSAGVPGAQRNMTLTGDDAKDAWDSGRPPAYGPAAANEVIKDLTNRSNATQKFIDVVDRLDRVATPTGIGKPGDVSEFVNNLGNTVNSLATTLGITSDTSKYQYPALNGSLFSQLHANGINAEQVKSLMLSAAMAEEATEGPKDSTDANRKFAVEMRMKQLGEDTSDIQALKAVLHQQRGMAIEHLNMEFNGKPNVMPKPQWLQRELQNYVQDSQGVRWHYNGTGDRNSQANYTRIG